MLDPASLAYVVLLHFEGDECGGMDRFMAEAKSAQLVGSDMSAILSLTSFGVDCVDRVKGVRDGDMIEPAGTSCASSRRRTCTTGTR